MRRKLKFSDNFSPEGPLCPFFLKFKGLTSTNAVKTQIWVAMIVYLILAIIKERYSLQNSLSQLLHFLEVNLFEKKTLISIFGSNRRKMHRKEEDGYKQLTLFDS